MKLLGPPVLKNWFKKYTGLPAGDGCCAYTRMSKSLAFVTFDISSTTSTVTLIPSFSSSEAIVWLTFGRSGFELYVLIESASSLPSFVLYFAPSSSFHPELSRRAFASFILYVAAIFASKLLYPAKSPVGIVPPSRVFLIASLSMPLSIASLTAGSLRISFSRFRNV